LIVVMEWYINKSKNKNKSSRNTVHGKPCAVCRVPFAAQKEENDLFTDGN